MRDQWTRIVSERLANLDLPDDERNEVIEEVAAHLCECADEIEAAGVADETDVTERTLAQVSDWRKLASQIRRAKEQRMSATGVDPYRRSSTSHRRLLAFVMTIAVVGGAAAGFLTATLKPARYRAQALLQVVPSKVSSEYVGVASPRPLDNRIRAIEISILSRTRLERLIREFDLYHSELVSQLMEEVVSHFREDISIQVEAPPLFPSNAVSVTYTGANPSTVMKVTERLAGYLKDESSRENNLSAESTMAFLESRSDDVGKRLQEQQARIAASHAPADRRSQMETQVLESTYVKVLTDMESARMQLNLDSRQMGEQFVLIDPARLPERAIGPTRAQYVGFGAAAGLSFGLLVALGITIARLWSSKRPQPLTQTA